MPSAAVRLIRRASSSPCAWACSAAVTRARPGRTCGSTASRPSPMGATSRSRRRTAHALCVPSGRRVIQGRRAVSQPAMSAETWQRFDKVKPHGTLMSVGLRPRTRIRLCRCALRRGVRHPGRRQDMARDAAATRRATHLCARLRLSYPPAHRSIQTPYFLVVHGHRRPVIGALGGDEAGCPRSRTSIRGPPGPASHLRRPRG